MSVDTSSACGPTGLAVHVDAARAVRVASVAKLLSDPVRVQLLDVLREHRGDVCQCELQPLFGVSQPTLSHHLRKLEEAGVVTVQRRGRWAYYAVDEDTLEVLRSWLS
jgi:ArsR family transcriptional regulator